MTRAEPKKMTDAQVFEWLRSTRHMVGDELADMMEAHLAALSSVPEDADLKRAYEIACQGSGIDGPKPRAIALLYTAATQVPGLEAACAEYERTINEDIDGKLALRRELGATDSETYPAFVRRLASERDAARQEVERLTEQLKYVTRAMEEGMGALRAQVEALREDNATLSALAKRGGAVLEERDALRARVAELEAALLEERRIGNDFRGRWGGAMEGKVLAEARATAAEKDASYWRGQYNAMKDHAEAPRPTPAPGLMRIEPHTPTLAASLELEKEVDADRHRDEDEARGSAMVSGGTPREAKAEAVRTTDAALAEERRALAPAPGLREAVGALTYAVRRGLSRDTEHANLTLTATRAEWTALLAAYDAPEPTVTHAALAAVERLRDFAAAVDDADWEDVDELRSSLEAQSLLADEVLRRVTGGKVPESLPTGPGGGETAGHEDCPDNPCPGHFPYCEGVGKDAEPPTQRARIPEPSHAEPVTLGKGPFQMLPDVAARAVERTHRTVTDAQPEPAAPDVVWQQDRVRVLADGTPEWRNGSGEWRPTSLQIVGGLARALAEAKRELAGSVRPEALAAVRKTAAEDMRERAASHFERLMPFLHDDVTLTQLKVVVDAIRALPLEDK